MPPDIRAFVDGIIAEMVREKFEYLTITHGVAAAEAAEFHATFGRDLPATYVEICQRCDGFTDPNMARLHGLQTIWRPAEEFPDCEGILEIHKDQLIDGVGREDFVEFGNRDGVEPWGWDLTQNCFIRSDPNRRDIMGRFDTFENMLRALFRLDRFVPS